MSEDRTDHVGGVDEPDVTQYNRVTDVTQYNRVTDVIQYNRVSLTTSGYVLMNLNVIQYNS